MGNETFGSEVSDAKLQETVNDVKKHGKGEVVAKISRGKIRKLVLKKVIE